jgi:hypothetical protein
MTWLTKWHCFVTVSAVWQPYSLLLLFPPWHDDTKPFLFHFYFSSWRKERSYLSVSPFLAHSFAHSPLHGTKARAHLSASPLLTTALQPPLCRDPTVGSLLLLHSSLVKRPDKLITLPHSDHRATLGAALVTHLTQSSYKSWDRLALSRVTPRLPNLCTTSQAQPLLLVFNLVLPSPFPSDCVG